jgi:olfactory receptor
VIPQIFCDVPSLLRISCSGSLMIIYISLGIGVCLGMSCFICVVISYIYIFSTVLKIPTTKGQSKAFGTCIPHLTVFSVFIATACFVYLKPPSNSASLTDRLFSVLYTVLPPALNPVIYSLRNNDVDSALKRLLQNLYSRDFLHVIHQNVWEWHSISEAIGTFYDFYIWKMWEISIFNYLAAHCIWNKLSWKAY